MDKINLNGGWALCDSPLSYGKEMSGYIANRADGWYTGLTLPLDVRMPLIDAGVMKDPVLADYCFDAEWVEQRAWWFKQQFVYEAWKKYDAVELVIASLDIHADIFLNGAYLGHHASAHFSFRQDVAAYVVPGENTLLIRLTAGLEYVSDRDLAEIGFAVSTEAGNGCPERGDKRRAFLRKPAYVFGWDWCPRAGSIAIGKNAFIECHRIAAIRSVRMETAALPDQTGTARVRAELEVELFDSVATADGEVALSLSLDGRQVVTGQVADVFLRAGLNYLTLELTVEDARLWWPNGMGEQPLYEVAASVSCRGVVNTYPPFMFGLRTITLDTGRMDANNRRFALAVNGKRIFCKGANWIPADLIYARVSPQKYDALVKEAACANFNMLRVWGGGLYERDEFYDACDRSGLLVWQDFMFACAAYPDHVPDMYALIGQELDEQTKRLASRACIAVFCGNNENHVALTQWYGDAARPTGEKRYGLKTANAQIPEMIRKNCPWVPYWNGSPFGGEHPDSYQAGDVHYWGEGMMNPDMDTRIDPRVFDRVTAKFVSEYGYPGPCVKESVSAYFDGNPVERDGALWNLHNNTFEKLTVAAGIKKHMDPRTFSALKLDEYLLFAGAVQMLMLEYSLESLRFKTFCGGGLFWMYNDCWGEVGWSVVDYRLNRKISFYGVRRAFEPVKLMMREQDGVVTVMGCNDTGTEVSFDLQYGYVRFDGSGKTHETALVVMPAYTRETVIIFNKGTHNPAEGIWYAVPADSRVRPASLHPFEVKIDAPPKASVRFIRDGESAKVTVTAETYCRMAYLEVSAAVRLSDNYFTLLPGESREIILEGLTGALCETAPVLQFLR